MLLCISCDQKVVSVDTSKGEKLVHADNERSGHRLDHEVASAYNDLTGLVWKDSVYAVGCKVEIYRVDSKTYCVLFKFVKSQWRDDERAMVSFSRKSYSDVLNIAGLSDLVLVSGTTSEVHVVPYINYSGELWCQVATTFKLGDKPPA